MTLLSLDERCLYFTNEWTLDWVSAHEHCQSLGGELAAAISQLNTFEKILPENGWFIILH